MSMLKNALSIAVIRLLKPMVRILLRHGFSHAEFSELAKLAFVDIAENEFHIAGRRQSVSRICVLTGLHRKDVNHIRERLQEDSVELEQLSRAARVISGWHDDSDFCDEEGNPKALPLEGQHSFTQLVKRYSGDMQVRAVLDELLFSGAVTENDDKHLSLVSQAYIPSASEEKMIQILGIASSDLLNTINHNLQRPDDEESRMQLVVDYKNIPEEDIKAFKAFSEKESLDMLKRIDGWLDKRASQDNEGKQTQRAGFGLYYFGNEIESVRGDKQGEEHV